MRAAKPVLQQRASHVEPAALALAELPAALAEHLAEVVTFHLYQEANRRSVSSSEIFAMIKAVLVATGNQEAAA